MLNDVFGTFRINHDFNVFDIMMCKRLHCQITIDFNGFKPLAAVISREGSNSSAKAKKKDK